MQRSATSHHLPPRAE